MHRGETISTTISGFPIPISEIRELYIVFSNQTRKLIEKTLKDCTADGETLTFRLTQEESLGLTRGEIKRQVVIITKDGSRLESCPSYICVDHTAKNGVL